MIENITLTKQEAINKLGNKDIDCNREKTDKFYFDEILNIMKLRYNNYSTKDLTKELYERFNITHRIRG